MMPRIVRKTRERVRDGDEDVLPIADGVHLVDGQHEMRNAEQVGERRVALRLRDNALARVDKQDGELRGACRRDHVARVLLVPRRVGDDELAPRRREVAIGDVDGDALLALRDEAVGEQRQVERLAALARRALDRRELVGEDRLRIVQQAADQRALAVVDAAGGQEPQHALVRPVDPIEGCHQKYPARLRNSIDASFV